MDFSELMKTPVGLKMVIVSYDDLKVNGRISIVTI
jgi:hypothetical protein